MSNGEQPNHIRITLKIPPEKLASFYAWAGTLATVPHRFVVETAGGEVPIVAAAAEAASEAEPVLEPAQQYALASKEGVTWLKPEIKDGGHEDVPIFTLANIRDFTPTYQHMMPDVYNKLVAECRRRQGFSVRYLYVKPENGAVLGLRAYTLPGLVEALKHDGTVMDALLNVTQKNILNQILDVMYVHEEGEPTSQESKLEDSA